MISAEKIPNNVNLSGNKRLQRALEHWQPKYIQWWRDMGPQGFQDYHQVYVRTAISVDPEGLGALRVRQAAGVPLGHLPRRSGARSQASASAISSASRSGRKCRASSATSCAG